MYPIMALIQSNVPEESLHMGVEVLMICKRPQGIGSVYKLQAAQSMMHSQQFRAG